jgi:hypothetical protein
MNWIRNSHSFNELSILLHAPARPGIYLLRSSTRCIYIGESENIRKTLLAHLHGDDPWITVWAPSRFSFDLCPDASRARMRDQLMAQLEPVIGYQDAAVANATSDPGYRSGLL